MEGMSLVPLVNEAEIKWRDEIFSENLYTGRDNPFCEGIRIGDWKYIRMFDGVDKYNENDIDFAGNKPGFEQLFNLKDDPKEMVNLIEKLEDNKILEELRAYSKITSGFYEHLLHTYFVKNTHRILAMLVSFAASVHKILFLNSRTYF